MSGCYQAAHCMEVHAWMLSSSTLLPPLSGQRFTLTPSLAVCRAFYSSRTNYFGHGRPRRRAGLLHIGGGGCASGQERMLLDAPCWQATMPTLLAVKIVKTNGDPDAAVSIKCSVPLLLRR
mmetsp:Transcript_35516/g.93205  ORF Transcript_35516/g.93205 Transcript_35516/m.93205 type:complete len:121 (+) Transcript_35516:296-658(+)